MLVMNITKSSKIRYVIYIILLFILLPVLAYFLYQSTAAELFSGVNNEISSTVKSAAFEQESWVTHTVQLLSTLALVPEIAAGSGDKCSKILTEVNDIYPRYENIGVVKTDGTILCGAKPFTEAVNGKLPAPDHSWFDSVVQNKQFAVGTYQFHPNATTPTLDFGFPILDDNGNLKNIIFAALNLEWVHELFNKESFPADSIAYIIDRQGEILEALPEAAEGEGSVDDEKTERKQFDEGIFAQIEAQKTGTTMAVGVDGINRIYSFTSLDGDKGDVIFVIGTPYTYVYKQALGVAYPIVIVFLMTTLVVVAIEWRLYRKKLLAVIQSNH